MRNNIFLLLIMTTLCKSAVGHAESQSGPVPRCDEQEECLALVLDAKRYDQVGKTDEMLKLYQQAYISYGDPRLLIFVGDAQAKLGRYEVAARAYRDYLQSEVDPPESQLVTKAQARLIDAEAAIARAKLRELQSQAVPRPGPVLPAVPQVAQTISPEVREDRRGRSRWRTGLGVSLAVLSALSLGTAATLTVLNGQMTVGTCYPSDGLTTQCQAGYLPLLTAGYAVSGAALVGSILTLTLR